MTPLLSPLFGWMFLEMILSAAVLALYLVSRRLLKNPADRYLFLKLSFAVIIVLPWLPLPSIVSLFSTVHSSVGAAVRSAIDVQIHATPTAASGKLIVAIAKGLTILYSVIVASLFTRIFASSVRLKALAEGARLIETRDGVPVLGSDARLPPATFGWIRPLILIPNSTLASLSTEDFELILDHETQHIARRDYLFNLLRAIVQAVLVFSPCVHWLGKKFIEEMELSCDALTMKCRPGAAKSYGNMLFRLGTQTESRMNFVCSGLFVSQSFLARRIAAMKVAPGSRNRIAPVAFFACLTLLVGPALTSWGVEDAIDDAIGSSEGAIFKGDQMTYHVRIERNGRQGAASHRSESFGTFQLRDGGVRELEFNILRLRIATTKEGQSWHLNVDLIDGKTAELLSSSRVQMSGQEPVKFTMGSTDNADGSATNVMFSLSPLVGEANRSAPQTNFTERPDGKVNLNFTQPTEIKDLIKTVASLTGKNVIVDRGVHGKITLDSDRPVTKPEAYQAFLQGIRLLDFDVVETAKVIKIVEKSKAG